MKRKYKDGTNQEAFSAIGNVFLFGKEISNGEKINTHQSVYRDRRD